MSAEVLVDGLSCTVKEERLRRLFSQVAPVTSVTLRAPSPGRTTTTAIVALVTEEQARLAALVFNGRTLGRQLLRVTHRADSPSIPETHRQPLKSVLRG